MRNFGRPGPSSQMRQTLQSLFGLELSTAQKVIVASVVILVLLALLGLFVRQIQGGRLRLRGQAGGRQRQPRLGVVDSYDLDRQRQLVLIRRDNVEHLVMIGGASDVVVEANIMRSGSRAVAPNYNETALPDRPLPPFETLVPPAEPPARPGDELRRTPAVAEAPDVLPPLPTRSGPTHGEVAAAAAASAGVAAALGLGGGETQPAPKPVVPPAPPAPIPPLTTGPAPSFAREHAPPPAVSAGELDDMTRQLEEALKRPFSAVRPANLPGEAVQESAAPPVKPPVPPVRPFEKPVAEAPKPPAEPVEPPPPLPPPPAPEPKVALKPEPAPVPAAPPRQPVLPSDVEAELAAALGLTPERTAPKPAAAPAPAPAPAVKAPEPKPVEMKAPEPPPPVAHPKPSEPTPVIDEDEFEEAFAAVAKPEPEREAKPEAVPEPEPEVKPKADKPAEPETKELDPFSVDAIEAEFARLLGRDPKAKS